MNTLDHYKELAMEYYDIPRKANIPLSEIEEKGILKRATALKAIRMGQLKAIKIMSKWFVPREALVDYLAQAIREGEEAAKRMTSYE